MTHDQIKFEALRNAIYHTDRRRFLDSINRWLNLIVIIAGASAVADLKGVADPRILAAVAALAGALQLVFDVGVKAHSHEYLQKRYYELLASVTEKLHADEVDLARWEGELMRIYGEEPPQMRALGAVAHNSACDTLGKKGDRVKIAWWYLMLRQIFPFYSVSFPDEKTSG